LTPNTDRLLLVLVWIIKNPNICLSMYFGRAFVRSKFVEI
jgi:hypothetical protein